MREVGLSIQDVKMKLELLKGQEIELSVNRGRNRIETFCATIKMLYPSVFTISCDHANSKTETFSYSDVLCSKVKFLTRNG